MRIFITGATGFIGTPLVHRLTTAGHEVTCLVADPDAVPGLADAGAHLTRGESDDEGAVLVGMRRSERVIHLALDHYWERDPARFAAVHVRGTRTVMETALLLRIPRVVHVSSALVYGRSTDRVVTEDSDPGPETFSERTRTLRDADRYVRSMHRALGLPVVVLLPGDIPGADFAPLLADVARGRVTALPLADVSMTWVHGGDVVEAIVSALDAPGVVGRAYLIGKYDARLVDLAALAGAAAGVAPPRLRVPAPLSVAAARVLTRVAHLTGHAPAWGLSTDHARSVAAGLRFDGSRAERELGITYSPLGDAVREAVEAGMGLRMPVASPAAAPVQPPVAAPAVSPIAPLPTRATALPPPA